MSRYRAPDFEQPEFREAPDAEFVPAPDPGPVWLEDGNARILAIT